MKILQCFFLSLMTVSAFATPVFDLTPVPPIVTMVPADGTANVSYTVTNNTPLTLTGNGLRYPSQGGTTPVGVTQVTGGAGVCADPFTLAGGASCTLNLLVTGANLVDGQAVGGPEVCNTKVHPVHCTFPTDANELNITTIPVFNLSLAVGLELPGPIPFFVQSQDAGTNWTLGALPTGVPTTGLFTSSTCSGTICVAAGADLTAVEPYLIYTTDNGDTWSKVSGLTGTAFFDASCVGVYCVAAGQTTTNGLLVQTQDNGTTWGAVSGQPVGQYLASSCSEAICVAGGYNNGTVPILRQTQAPLGDSWTVVPVTLPPDGQFNDASCSGDLCLVVGQTISDIPPDGLLMRTINGGDSWDAPTTFTDLRFSTVSCVGTLCVLGGYDGGIDESLLAISTTSGGSPFGIISTPPPVPLAEIVSVSCSPLICAAAGNLLTGGGAFVFQSVDGGINWTDETITGPNDRISFVSCDAGFCVAAGFNTATNAPILIQTTDTGLTWAAVPPVTGMPAMVQFAAGTASATTIFRTEMDYFKKKGL